MKNKTKVNKKLRMKQTEGSGNNVHLVQNSVSFSDSSSVFSVESDCVDFIDEGQGSVAVSDVAKLFQRTNRAGHGVDSLKGHDLNIN